MRAKVLSYRKFCCKKILCILQLWSDWGDSTRCEGDGWSEGDHGQVVLQGLFVELWVDHHPLDLSLDAWFFITCGILVQYNVNLRQMSEIVICKNTNHVEHTGLHTCVQQWAADHTLLVQCELRNPPGNYQESWKFPGTLKISRGPGFFQALEISREPGIFQVCACIL